MTIPEISGRIAEHRVQHQGHRVRLRERRRGQGRDRGNQREDPRQRRRAETIAQVVHRSRQHRVAAGLAERHAEDRLRELDRGGDEAIHPDPEERAGTARDDRRRDPGDVAGPDRRAERRHERLKWRQRARAFAGAPHQRHPPGLTEPPDLDEPGSHRQPRASSQQHQDDPRHEQRVGQRFDEMRHGAVISLRRIRESGLGVRRSAFGARRWALGAREVQG